MENKFKANEKKSGKPTVIANLTYSGPFRPFSGRKQ
jgi:hypothetical protein